MNTSKDMVQVAFKALDEKLAADINVIDISTKKPGEHSH